MTPKQRRILDFIFSFEKNSKRKLSKSDKEAYRYCCFQMIMEELYVWQLKRLLPKIHIRCIQYT